MTIPPEFRHVCEQAARAGGAVLLDWKNRFSVQEKGPSDLVTEADLASQQTIREILLKAFPRHGFLGEEAEQASIEASDSDGHRWVVDPLDGTTNYVHGLAEFAVSVALHQQDKVLVGTVYQPTTDDCYTAAAGQGAFLNGRRLSTSRVTEISQAMLALSFPAGIRRDDPGISEFIEVLLQAQTVRRIGSAALNLCHLAAGHVDGYWSRYTKVWDVAAGLLLVQEAGGHVTDMAGGPLRLDPPEFIAAATVPLHSQLSELLARARG